MKVGILTLPFNVNYGGILQSYALQTYLMSKGHQIIIINRVSGRPDLIILTKRLLSLGKCLYKKYILNDVEVVISNPFGTTYLTKRYHDLDWKELRRFVADNLRLSNPLTNTRQVRKLVEDMGLECLLVGSDQVWRDCYSPNIYNYFGDFISGDHIKKIAYAASFGVSDKPIPNYKLSRCIRLSHKFNHISVRETAAVDYMRNVFGITPEKVLDPTLLLDSSEYSRFINEVNPFNDKFIACYILNMTKEKMKILEYMQTLLGIKLRILSSEPTFNKSQFAVSVEEWLTVFAYSDFVLTDSYHGSIFAVQFHKQFLAISNSSRGNERFFSFLSELGLENRLVDSYEQLVCKLERKLPAIDYIKVEAKLLKERLHSKAYLDAVLSPINK